MAGNECCHWNAYFHHHQAARNMKKHLALIIGSMKSGTTSLFDHLVGHPHVVGCVPKEPGFFAFDEIYANGEIWYESLFDFDSKQHLVALDASTDYSKFPHCGDVAGRIERLGIQPKLIYIMRNPLRRIESHARHVQFTRMELGQYISPRKNHSLDDGISEVSMDISKYSLQIDQYINNYRNGNLKLIVLEDLSHRPREVMAEICQFLNIDETLLPKHFEQHNVGSSVRRRSTPHPIWQAAKSIRPLREAVTAIVPASTRHRIRSSTAQKVRLDGRFQLSADEEQRILEILSDDLRKLREFYEIDIERHWGIKTP